MCRQVGIKFKCLNVQEEGYKQWLERSNVYLDKVHVPFDMQVEETATGIYQIQVKGESKE